MFNETTVRILSILSGLLCIVATFPYVHAIIRDRNKKDGAKPSKATWLIWATLDTMTLAAMITKGSINGLIVTAVFSAWTILFMALKYGVPGWTSLDKFCLAGAVLGIVLWFLSGNPSLCIITSVSVLLIGSIPTFRSAWENPKRENGAGWFLGWLSCVLTTVAIPHWTIADAAQPMVFLTIESVMVYLIFVKPIIEEIRYPAYP